MRARFRGGSASPDETGEPRKPSKLAAFLSTNKAESHLPTFTEGGVEETGDGGGGATNGRLCKVQGCFNQAVQDVAVCPVHARRCGHSPASECRRAFF